MRPCKAMVAIAVASILASIQDAFLSLFNVLNLWHQISISRLQTPFLVACVLQDMHLLAVHQPLFHLRPMPLSNDDFSDIDGEAHVRDPLLCICSGLCKCPMSNIIVAN